MRARDAGVGAITILVGALLTSSGGAQQPPSDGPPDSTAWRAHFAEGLEAWRADDAVAYADRMRQAAEAMPDGLLNRPFVQYHAARASALAGRSDEAVAWLERAWDEDIEALMISFASYDPAFESMRDAYEFRAVLGRADSMQLGVRRLARGVVLITGAGANIVAHLAPDGVTLVDTGYLPAAGALQRTLESLAAGPIRRIVVTHPHEDHMGGTVELGTRATVYAHDGTAAAMAEPYAFIDGVTVPAKPESARPDVAVVSDTSFIFGGTRVRLIPTPAHTSGDLTVYFPEARVAHFGDTYLAGDPVIYPGSDDPEAFLSRLEAAVASMRPRTIVISGHDEPSSLDDVRAKLRATRDAIALTRSALDEGLSLEEVQERAEGRFPPQWIAFFYRVLAEG